MDLGLFFGRFHPLIIHLPIGIILVALLLEWWGKASKETLQRLWFYGMLTAVIAAFIGWLLAGNGAYAPSTLRWHKWLGIGTCVAAFGIWYSYKVDWKSEGWIPKILRVGLLLLLTIGGHKGGTLTHGEGYLVEGAPTFIQKIAGYNSNEPVDLSAIHVDSILTYEHLVHPILESKCLSCHNPKAVNGGLDISTKEAMLSGGDSGPVIESGNAANSELFKRVVLSQSEMKFMPPKGIPLNYNEMEILKSWIDGGAIFSEKSSSTDVSRSMIEAVQAVYGIDLSPKPWYMKSDVPPADSMIIQSLIAKGYQITRFSEIDNYLKVVLPRKGNYSELGLEAIGENIIVLEAKGSDLDDDAINEFVAFPNLLRLDLSNSSFSSEAFIKLPPFSRLESLNLFGSSANDAVLQHTTSFPLLTRVFVWQSSITDTGISAFENSRNDVVVERGF